MAAISINEPAKMEGKAEFIRRKAVERSELQNRHGRKGESRRNADGEGGTAERRGGRRAMMAEATTDPA